MQKILVNSTNNARVTVTLNDSYENGFLTAKGVNVQATRDYTDTTRFGGYTVNLVNLGTEAQMQENYNVELAKASNLINQRDDISLFDKQVLIAVDVVLDALQNDLVADMPASWNWSLLS